MTPSTRPHGVRSREIGKQGERAVVRALTAHGFTAAERLKAGRLVDPMDIAVCPGVLASVKAGEAAKGASLARVVHWRECADHNRRQAGAELALLVVQRRGAGPANADQWRTWIIGADRDHWETTLAAACAWLHKTGWGPRDEGAP